MSVEATETGEEGGGETPAGFPSEQSAPLDIEAEADARALAVLTRASDGDGSSGEPEEPAPTEDQGEAEEPEDSEPTEEPPAPSGETAEPAPNETPQVTEALAQVLAMKDQLEKSQAEVNARLEQMKDLDAREKELERYQRFDKRARNDNLFAALQELYPDKKPDDMVRAIAEGRGTERPEDQLEAMREEIRAEFTGELDKLRQVQEQREAAEIDHIVSREVSTTAAENAPLVAAFGEQGLAAVRRAVDTARENGTRVTSETVRTALADVEGDLVQNFLTVALRSEGVRKKYADVLRGVLGTSDKADQVPTGHSLSNRATSQVTRRASTEALTEEERDELARSHLRR